MATGVLKSFNHDRALAIVRLEGRSAEVALRVSGCDKTTIASLRPGQKIQFDLACGQHGQVYAVDVAAEPAPPLDGRSADFARRFHRPLPAKTEGRASVVFEIGSAGGTQKQHAAAEDLERQLLSAPVIHRLMEKGRVDPLAVRTLVRSVARAATKQQ